MKLFYILLFSFLFIEISNGSENRPISQKSKNYRMPKNYKSEMCRHISNNVQCPHGSKCNFAHSISELRSKPSTNQYTKSIECFHRLSTGACPYYHRCQFSHTDGLDGNYEPCLQVFYRNSKHSNPSSDNYIEKIPSINTFMRNEKSIYQQDWTHFLSDVNNEMHEEEEMLAIYDRHTSLKKAIVLKIASLKAFNHPNTFHFKVTHKLGNLPVMLLEAESIKVSYNPFDKKNVISLSTHHTIHHSTPRHQNQTFFLKVHKMIFRDGRTYRGGLWFNLNEQNLVPIMRQGKSAYKKSHTPLYAFPNFHFQLTRDDDFSTLMKSIINLRADYLIKYASFDLTNYIGQYRTEVEKLKNKFEDLKASNSDQIDQIRPSCLHSKPRSKYLNHAVCSLFEYLHNDHPYRPFRLPIFESLATELSDDESDDNDPQGIVINNDGWFDRFISEWTSTLESLNSSQQDKKISSYVK